MKDLLKLLQSVERKRPVGTLVLGRRGRSCDLFVEGDRLFYAGKEWSGRVDVEALSRANILGERLSPVVLEAAISGTNLIQKALPDALLERGIIDGEEWSTLMASHVCEEVFTHAFRHADSFAFHEAHVPEHLLDEDPRKALLPIGLLIQTLDQRAQTAAIVGQLIPSRKEVLVPTERGMAHHKSAAADLGLKRILDAIDGFRTLNELIRDVPFFEFYILCRLVEALQSGHLKKTVLPEVKDVNIAKVDRAEAERLLPAFKWAVKHAVDEVGARERLAALYERLGQNEEAVIQYNFIGDALYRMKKLSRALKAFQRALELHPGDPLVTDKVVKAYVDAAEEAVREGKRDVAFTLLNAAAKIRPDMLEITERILSLSIEALDLRRVADLCGAVAERSRSVRDITPALKVLRTVVEKFPRERSYRKKLVNIFLDFGMNEEAVAELEELAELEGQDGKSERVQEIWEKIVRIDPGRDDNRKRLKGAARRAAARRLPSRRVPLVKTALLLLLVVAGYQYWSYLELEPFRERRLAHGESPGPRNASIVRSEREEKLLALVEGVERHQKRFPLSLFSSEAQKLQKLYREEAGRMARDREKLKQEVLDQASVLVEKGQKEAAVKTLKRLLVLPAGDPWRASAVEGIKRLDRYEKDADELLHSAEQSAGAGDWETCYRLLRRVLDEHGLSNAATRVEVPVLVRTIPEGAA
ncbi:MAG: tetratricopeptide repeat protein, partial [Thermoanaerobaculia bacterium]